MKKCAFVVAALLSLIVATALGQNVEMSYFAMASEAYQDAQLAQERAKALGYAATKSDYYQSAMKHYRRALMYAQNSIDTREALSRSEKYKHKQIMSEAPEQIKKCQLAYNESVSVMNAHDLQKAAYRFMLAGFNFATSGDTASAKINWREALRLYRQALSLTSDIVEREVINQKIKEVNDYMETYLEQ